MAAAAVQRDIMRMFYSPPPRDQSLPKPIVPERQAPFEDFVLARNNFQGWLHVWKMEPLPEKKYNQGDIYRFGRAHKRKFVEVVKNELRNIGNIKVSFRLRQEFSRVVYDSDEFPQGDYEEGRTQIIKHYFEKDQPTIIMRGDSEERIKQKFEDFIEMVKGETDNWSEAGSGWEAGDIDLAYIEVARYNPLRGGTYLPLPASLAEKKAIINVRNNDNRCFRWAIKAALFPVEKDAQRKSKYPVDDGIDNTGIEFPTPKWQINRLEAQNRNLAINVYGWKKMMW